jgi:hypothetical protein
MPVLIGEYIMKTSTTAVAKSVAALSIATVFVNFKYEYKGEVVKVIKIRKKANEVIVMSEVDKMKFTVRPHELEEVKMTNEEKAVQAAYVDLKSAQKAYEKADKVFRTEKAKAGSVSSATFKKAVVDRASKLFAVELAQKTFSEAKYGLKGYDRHDVEEGKVSLNTEELEAFLAEAMDMFAEIDKEMGKELSHIYGLIAIYNIVNIAKKLNKADPTSDYTTAFRIAMGRLKVAMTEDTETNFKNVWNFVFGGRNKKGPIKALTEMYGKDLTKLALHYNNYALVGYEASPLVHLDLKGLNVQVFAGQVAKRISLRDTIRRLEYVNQVVFVRTLEKEGNTVAQIARSMTALQRVVGMHSAGIAFEGLRNNDRFNSIVKVGFKGKAWEQSTAVIDPLCVLVEGEDMYTADQLAIAEAVRKEGFGICSSAENYSKHGYVQKVSSYNDRGANAFINADGSTYEDVAKLPPRLGKQAWNEDGITFTGVRTIVCAAVKEADLPTDVMWADQQVINKDVELFAVAGGSTGSKRLYSFMGTGRVVSGKESDSSGQKTVIAGPEKLMVPALEDVYFNVGGGHDEEFVLTGLNSTKSAKFKFANMADWKLVKVAANGVQGYVWVKEAVETYVMTYSATANAFRAVDEKVVGVEAALNSLARATESLQSETATKLIYAKNGKTLFENIQTLLAEGKIEKKGYHVATNSQFNTGLEMQHGVGVARKVIEALVTANRAISFRKSMSNALALVKGDIDSNDIADVKASSLIGAIASGCSALGIPAEDVQGKVLHVSIVMQVMQLLSQQDKPWVRINFSKDKSVLIPVTQEFLDGFQETGRPFYVALEGMAAELFDALAYHVQKAAVTIDEETGIPSYAVEFTDATIDIAISNISKARDNEAGKPLNKIPAYGTTLLLVTSAHLRGNQMFSSIAQEIERIASKAYRQHVTCLYFKSPLLWNGSISTTDLVTQIGNNETAAWLEQFGGTEEYNRVMEGTASFISPEKAVKNGNDVDGDQNSIIFSPSKALIGSRLSNEQHFIDATDPKNAAGANHYAAHWENELKGVYLDTTKTIVLKDGKEFEAQFQVAVARAAKEKTNVAIFTSHQTATLNNRGAYTSAFESALKRVVSVAMFTKYQGWANTLLNDTFALEQASEAFWAFNADVQGSLVNLDAMDQVKSSEGRNIKKLAALLSSGELKFLSFTYAKENAPEGTSIATVAQSVTKGLMQRAEEVYNTMFKPTAHNIAVDQLNYVLPVYNDNEAAIVKLMVAYILVVCGANVGYVAATKYDVCQQVAATAQKVNGRAIPANLETIAAVQADKGKTVVEVDCIQRTIADIAVSFVGKVLV